MCSRLRAGMVAEAGMDGAAVADIGRTDGAEAGKSVGVAEAALQDFGSRAAAKGAQSSPSLSTPIPTSDGLSLDQRSQRLTAAAAGSRSRLHEHQAWNDRFKRGHCG
jgi:hypothetical protein